MTKHYAFTLVEMLLVTTLLAMLAGAVVVSLHGRQDQHLLRIRTGDLASAMRFAAREARVHNQVHRVVFLDDHTAWRVEVLQQAKPEVFHPTGGMAGTTRRLTKGVRVSRAGSGGTTADELPNDVRFTPQGPKQPGWLELANRLEERFRITVYAETGEVRILEVQEQQKRDDAD